MTCLRLTIALFVGVVTANVTSAADPSAIDSPADARTRLLKTFAGEFVAITPGEGRFPETFRIGSPDGPASEQPARTIRMDQPFAIGKYEVPQSLYAAVMGKNPSRWTGPRNSVEMVSFQDARAFCARATQMMRQAGLIEPTQVVRLPSEAEWEYCCRAGTETAYSFGDSATKPGDKDTRASALDEYAWHTGNAAGNDPPVGALKPNPWGLYDMHGYLWEYVADAWHPSHEGRPDDASARNADQQQTLRVIRGGSWRDRHELLRSAVRWPIPDHAASDAIGFRCVLADITTDQEKEQK